MGQIERIDISDSSLKKNYFDIASGSNGDFYLAGLDYNGGGIYAGNINSTNSTFKVLFDSEDIFLFSAKILKFESNSDDILLAGGYFKNCQCGVLLRENKKTSNWDKIFFDDLDNPFTSSIFSISVNNTNPDGTGFNRVFLACGNGIIYYSDDTAHTFKKADINADNEIIMKIAFVDNLTGYAIAGSDMNLTNKIYKTTDGGLKWTLLKDFSNKYIAIHYIFVRQDTVLISGSELTHGMMMLSFDAGETFEPVKYNSNHIFPTSLISIVSMNNKTFAVDENGVMYISEGTLRNWSLFSGIASLGKFTSAKVISGKIISAGYYGKVFRTK